MVPIPNQLNVLTLILSMFMLFSVCGSNSNNPDVNALLSFRANTGLSNCLSSWVNTTEPCTHSWFGVTCNPTTHRVTGLVLENLNLTGATHPLSQLTELRLLSLKHNRLSASPFLNLSSWPNLKHLYLSHNRFAGEFPAGVSHLRRLKRLDISHNNFSGEIPMDELARLPRLLTLRLESNSFSGTLDPVTPSPASVLDFDVSNNKLSGEIPAWMSRFPEGSFVGNENLCGEPLPHNCSSNRTAEVASVPSGGGEGGVVVLMMTVAIVLVMILAAAVTLTCCLCKRKSSSGGTHKERKSGTHKEIYVVGGGVGGGGGVWGGGLEEVEEMVVFEGWKGLSKVGELLKCSAELLGKGSVGTTYKVVMDGGDAVVVKRVREKRRKRKGEVDGWLGVIGSLRHANVVSLKAYHNSKDELLLVYDYLPSGSLHSLLHGNRGPWRTPLDWTTRLNLASGAAQGLAFLHCYNKAKLFHGHLTSSNIIVDQMGNACISDIGLHQILHTPSSSNNAYIAPELVLNNNGSQRGITQKCDVYSFGVILLEILTGKMVTGEEETSLVTWVQRVGREELTGEVFDLELFSYKEMEEQMVALLQVALLCLAPLPKDRPKMSLVHRMIEDIKTKGASEGGENFIMNDLSSESSQSTPH